MRTPLVYSPQELQRIQSYERQTLKVILDVCGKLGIPCFLIGGSALGAVRHGGFIPWDDDIDVGMLRADYERFLLEAPAFLPKGYSLQTPYTDSGNPYCYAKLRVDGTRFVEYCNHTNRRMHHGVYVDVFPYDEVPDDETQNIRQFERAQRLMRQFSYLQSRDTSRAPVTRREKTVALTRIALHYVVKAFTSHDRLLRRIEETVTAWNGSGQQALACLNFPKRKCEYALRKDLFPLTQISFEGLPVMIPGNYDAYLTTHYGDYRKLPPEEDRVGHRPYEVQL